jgi:hypothetical protein
MEHNYAGLLPPMRNDLPNMVYTVRRRGHLPRTIDIPETLRRVAPGLLRTVVITPSFNDVYGHAGMNDLTVRRMATRAGITTTALFEGVLGSKLADVAHCHIATDIPPFVPTAEPGYLEAAPPATAREARDRAAEIITAFGAEGAAAVAHQILNLANEQSQASRT